MGRIVLVCGGREFNDYQFLRQAMDQVHKEQEIVLVVNGDAKGADRLAQAWCRFREVPFLSVPARWTKLGVAAGHIRNKKMLELVEKVDLVVAFPGGKGTENMISLAKEHKIPVFRVKFSQEIEENKAIFGNYEGDYRQNPKDCYQKVAPKRGFLRRK